jgi:hypothetical protein
MTVTIPETINSNYRSVISRLDKSLDTSPNITNYKEKVKKQIDNNLKKNQELIGYYSGLGNMSNDAKENIKKHIELAIKSNNDDSVQVLKSLSNRINDEKNRSSDFENNKNYINYLKSILDTEQSILNENIKFMKDDIVNKKRNVEINKYFEKKYIHQRLVMKRAVFIILVLLVITLLYKISLLTEFIFSALIGLGFAILFIYIIISLWDMSRRDRRYYDEYLFLNFQGKSGTGDDGENVNLPLHLRPDIPSYCSITKSQSST